MFFIPGWLISLLTFPGVVVHEIAHRIFCHLSGVPVYQVAYFRPFGNPAGYVVHGNPATLRASFLITMGPLLVNSLLCMLLTFAGIIPVIIFQDSAASGISGFMVWIGLSIGMHAFPSNHDAEAFIDQVHDAERRGLFLFAAQTFVVLLKIANALRVIWFDLIYAVLLAALLPLAFGLY